LPFRKLGGRPFSLFLLRVIAIGRSGGLGWGSTAEHFDGGFENGLERR
jgi:hypothetical protein